MFTQILFNKYHVLCRVPENDQNIAIKELKIFTLIKINLLLNTN